TIFDVEDQYRVSYPGNLDCPGQYGRVTVHGGIDLRTARRPGAANEGVGNPQPLEPLPRRAVNTPDGARRAPLPVRRARTGRGLPRRNGPGQRFGTTPGASPRGLLEQRRDIRPQLLPRLALLLGQLGQRRGIAHALQVRVLLPVRHLPVEL